VDLTSDMKKRGARLLENLALQAPQKSQAEHTHSEAVDEAHVKKSIADLHDVVVSFVANPIFKNLGVVDTKEVDAATKDLCNIMDLSDEIKREARTLGKPAKN
jgi:hypothetical protein